MTIAAFGLAATPSDNGTLYDAGPGNVAITPPASMVTGDLVVLICSRKNLADIAMGVTGGQSWNTGTLRQSGSSSAKVFWCRYNGTWAANPTIVSINNGAILISILMLVARPTSGSNTWALDIAEAYHIFSAPTTPFDVTATGGTTVAASTIALAIFHSLDKNTWALQTPGWLNFGNAQYRNADTVAFKNQSLSVAYQVFTSAGATGNIVNRQATLGGDAGFWIFLAFKEQGSGVSVTTPADVRFHNGETGIVITGTSFGASHTGSADIIVSPTNNIADGSAVVQTQTAWSDTSATFTASLGSFAYDTNLYLFVKNSSGQSNATGLVIQREAIANITAVLKNLAGSTINSVTGIDYRVMPIGINQTPILSGSNGSTDGSGNIAVGPYTLISGGPLAPNDDVWVVAARNDASQALSFATAVKVTPTYT